MRTVWVLLTQAILLLLVVVLIPVEAQSAELDGSIKHAGRWAAWSFGAERNDKVVSISDHDE